MFLSAKWVFITACSQNFKLLLNFMAQHEPLVLVGLCLKERKLEIDLDKESSRWLFVVPYCPPLKLMVKETRTYQV